MQMFCLAGDAFANGRETRLQNGRIYHQFLLEFGFKCRIWILCNIPYHALLVNEVDLTSRP